MTQRLYRPHRGGFAESMAAAVPVYDLRRLADIVGCHVNDISVDFYCYDTRNRWDTHVVKVDGEAVGFTSGSL